MATTINNTTINSRLTIVFDAAGSSDGNGPASGTGNTESDVYVDNTVYYNLRSHTEIDANVHAFQWNATTNTGELEFTDNRENEPVSSVPQWVANVVIRCEAEDIWQSAHDDNIQAQVNELISANPDLDKDTVPYDDLKSEAITAADTARNNYLSSHNITF